MMRFLVALIIASLFLAGGMREVSAQEVSAVVEIADPSPNDVRELMRLLADTRVQNWLGKKAEEIPEKTLEGKTIREQLDVGFSLVRVRMAALGQAWQALPQTPTILHGFWRSEMGMQTRIRALTFLVIFLFVGAGMEWLYRQYTTIPMLRLMMQSHAPPRKRALAAVARLAITIVGLMLFTLGSVGTFLSFEWPPFIEVVILNLLLAVIFMRVARALSVFIYAPKAPDLRLVPMKNVTVKKLHLLVMHGVRVIVYAVAIVGIFSNLMAMTGGDNTSVTLSVTVVAALVVALVLAAINFLGFNLWHQLEGKDNTARRMNWQLYLYVVIAVTFFLWLIGTGPLMWSVLAIGLFFPVLRLLHNWVNYFFDEAEAAFSEERDRAMSDGVAKADESELDHKEEVEDTPELPVIYGTVRLVTIRVVRFLAILFVALIVVSLWGVSIPELSKSGGVFGRVVSVTLDALFVILLADLVWTWAKTSIDKRLAAYKPPEDGQAPGPEARMATLLPLLRMTLLVTLLIMILFSILSSLGVNIAPLIAGAGVLGIAIGFGAQALVRDIVSGVFFLIDDAFRIGEYIEIGELRGTVEGISIRSLRVRHHRGMVHTIPFGELKSLTNHSRDWVIMKLEFRVPFETDLQLVKKLVKKVGAELLANEFYGKSILSTLKSQGVRRMEEFNMVVGVKFMTKPGEQWLVRRDAYQKVRDIFDANGIRMAERNVVVEIQGGDDLSEAEKKAAAGAAQAATEGPRLPPGPMPDEP